MIDANVAAKDTYSLFLSVSTWFLVYMIQVETSVDTYTCNRARGVPSAQSFASTVELPKAAMTLFFYIIISKSLHLPVGLQSSTGLNWGASSPLGPFSVSPVAKPSQLPALRWPSRDDAKPFAQSRLDISSTSELQGIPLDRICASYT